MGSRKPVERRRLRFMLENYLRANNIVPTRTSPKRSRASERRNPRISARPPALASPRAPTPDPIVPDTEDGPFPPDLETCDPTPLDNLNDESARPGPSRGAQTPTDTHTAHGPQPRRHNLGQPRLSRRRRAACRLPSQLAQTQGVHSGARPSKLHRLLPTPRVHGYLFNNTTRRKEEGRSFVKEAALAKYWMSTTE